MTRNCVSSFANFAQKTKHAPGAFWYGRVNDYFVFTHVVSGRDELARRDTNFRYQAILPLTDFQVLCAAGYDIKSIINTLFTQQLLNNQGRDYQPQLAKQITADDLEQIALFDYQAGLAQLEAQFQDQDLFENSLTGLIYDQSFRLHFASSPNGEALVYALWHLLPLPTRMQIGVSTGLPDENDAMYKTCVAKNVTTIALQFQNNTALKLASEQALNSIDTQTKDFRAIKMLYVKPLLAAIKANNPTTVLALQRN